ncbi:putative hemolysin [Amorphus suaedae]
MKIPALAALTALALAACSPTQEAPGPAAGVGLANPASVYCGEKGGRLEAVKTAAGVSNDCVLPGGERIDEWALYRRDHNS